VVEVFLGTSLGNYRNSGPYSVSNNYYARECGSH